LLVLTALLQVLAEISARIKANGGGTWKDPHNGGSYHTCVLALLLLALALLLPGCCCCCCCWPLRWR